MSVSGVQLSGKIPEASVLKVPLCHLLIELKVSSTPHNGKLVHVRTSVDLRRRNE